MTRITITGYYGTGNLGDDMMLRGLLRSLSRVNLKSRIRVFSFNNYESIEIANFEEVEIIKLPGTRTYRSLSGALKTLWSTDILLYGGGTVFTDSSGDGSFKLFILAKLLGCKIGYIGVGLGSLTKTSRILKTRILLRLSYLVVFRERTSFDHAVKIAGKRKEFLVRPDLWYLDYCERMDDLLKKSRQNNSIVICLRPIDQYVNNGEHSKVVYKNIYDNLVRLIISEQYSHIELVTIDNVKDRNITSEFQEYLSDKGISAIVYCELKVNEKLEKLASARFVFSMRLHSSYTAYYCNVPFHSVAYSTKLNIFHDHVNNSNYTQLSALKTKGYKMDLLQKNTRENRDAHLNNPKLYSDQILALGQIIHDLI
jgi:polysaccharide pyruvyl transferase WcaK-like protein